MRAVFIGASSLSIMTARQLLNRGHEVVIIDYDKSKLDILSETLDCGYIHGDGSKPALLRETAPSNGDTLFCLTGNDQTNILASLVGRSLGFRRVVTKIVDPELEHLCIELGLEDTIIPARTIGRFLADKFEGHDLMELSTMIREEARIFSFVVHEEDEGPIADLKLPDHCRVVCIYRDNRFIIPRREDSVKSNDEVIVLAHSDKMPELMERWNSNGKTDAPGK